MTAPRETGDSTRSPRDADAAIASPPRPMPAVLAALDDTCRREMRRRRGPFARAARRLVADDRLPGAWLPGHVRAAIARRLPTPTPTVVRGLATATINTRRHALLVSHDLSQSGAPKIVVELARILIGAGYGVVVVTPYDGPMSAALVGMKAVVVVDPRAFEDGGPLVARLGAAADVAFCNTVVSAAAVRTLEARVPTIWYLHEVSLITDLLRDDPSRAADFARPHAVWCGSEHSAVLVRPHRPDVRVVPYGLDALQPLDASPTPVDRPVRIAVFGSLEPRKGQDLAVDAIKRLPDVERRGVELTFHGRVLLPAFRDALQAAIGDAPVVIGEELDADGYRRALLASDVVLVPSRDDTLPLVSLDALGARRVLACTPTTGTAAYLHDGVDGFVARDATADGIAAMLSALLARRDEWPAIAARGAQVFARSFSKDTFATVVLEAVDAAVASAVSAR